MTYTLETKLRAKFDWLHVWSDEFDGDVNDDRAVSIATTLATGTGANKANKIWYDQRTLTLATGTDLLDLAGVLTDRWGESLTFTLIKALYICNLGIEDPADTFTPTAGQDLLVGGAGAVGNAWATLLNGNQDAELTVRSGGVLVLTAPMDGYSVVAGSDDILQILHDGSAASGGDITYDIALAGE